MTAVMVLITGILVWSFGVAYITTLIFEAILKRRK